jgi:hypothetical protein
VFTLGWGVGSSLQEIEKYLKKIDFITMDISNVLHYLLFS